MTWRTIIVFLSALGPYGFVHAQHVSAAGKFSVDFVKGCRPLTVTVTPIGSFTCDNSNPCAAFYENNSTSEPLINQPFTHTYNQAGVYTLKILQSALYDSIQIEVVDDVKPAFDVFTCSNNEVSVSLNDPNYEEYVVNFNDGTPESAVNGSGTANHVFASSAQQTITVRGRNADAADNCPRDTVSVTPLITLAAPTIRLLEVLDNSSIRLEYDILPNIEYKLGIAVNNGTTFQQLKSFSNQAVDTIFNLDTENNYYCFRLAAFDPCNNIVLNSAAICSSKLDVAARNRAMDVSWATSLAGISGFRLERTASDGTVFNTAPPRSPYTDTGVICGTRYCYQLTTDYPNGSRSVSLSVCETGFSTETPTAIENITAIAGDNSLLLEWQTDPDFIPQQFSIEKSIGEKFKFLDTTNLNAFSDTRYKVEDASCYRISYKDLCGNESPVSLEACPIRLSGDLRKDNSTSLTWTPYEGWANGVSAYIVEKYSPDGQLLQTFQAGTSLFYVDTSNDPDFQSFVYVVKATAIDPGLSQAVSNRVRILKDPNLFHPTAFTPNGDNLNDVFTVFGQYVSGFEMLIFNRWGELLFTTTNIEAGWDGTFKGKEMPEGTYTFIAYITDRAGRTFKRSGSVLLLRKGG